MKIKALILPLSFLIISLVGCTGPARNANQHAELGMSKREVMNQIGNPDQTNTATGKWYYYDSSFSSKYNLMKELLQSSNEADHLRAEDVRNELYNMHFTYRMISFSDDKVCEYFYDTNHRYGQGTDYDSWGDKEQTDSSITDVSSINCYRDDNDIYPVSDAMCKCEAKYEDGSIYRVSIPVESLQIASTDKEEYLASYEFNNMVRCESYLQCNVFDAYIEVEQVNDNNQNAVNNMTGAGLYRLDDIVNLVASVKDGYSSNGWYSENGESLSTNNQYSFTIDQLGKQKYTFRTSTIAYQITYNLDGGTNNSKNPTQYTVNSQSYTLADPTRTHNKFLGWYDNSGNRVYTIGGGATGNVELTARWEERTLTTVYLDYDDSVLFEGTSSLAEGYLDYPYDEPTREDSDDKIYDFKEWEFVSEKDYKKTYVAVYKESTKEEKTQEYIASMAIKIKNRVEWTKRSNDTKEVNGMRLNYVHVSNISNYLLDFDAYVGLNEDSSLTHSLSGAIVIDEETFNDPVFYSYFYTGGARYDSSYPLEENYSFEAIRVLYNKVFKGKNIVIDYLSIDGQIWWLHYPENATEVNNDIYDMEKQVLSLISEDFYEKEHQNNLYISNGGGGYYGYYHALTLNTVEGIEYSGGGFYVVLNGTVECMIITYDNAFGGESIEYVDYSFRIFLITDYSHFFKVDQAVGDVVATGDTLFENYDSVTLMYIYNAVMFDETTVYRYYVNGKMYNPNSH